MTRTAQTSDKVMLRLPDGWRKAIKIEAIKSHRTMNGELVAAIEAGMKLKGVQLDGPRDE